MQIKKTPSEHYQKVFKPKLFYLTMIENNYFFTSKAPFKILPFYSIYLTTLYVCGMYQKKQPKSGASLTA